MSNDTENEIAAGREAGKAVRRPWTYQEDSDAYTHIVRGPGNVFIVQLGQGTDGISEATARLIVRAVNAHDDLVAACEALPNFDLDPDMLDAADFSDHAQDFINAMQLARVALAKAKS